MSQSAHLAPPAGLLAAQPETPPRRPLWMLLALALAFGPLLALLFNEYLSDMVTHAVNALGIEVWQRAARHGVRLAVHLLLPVCVALAVLRFTPLGRWLVVTRFSLVCLLLADAVILLATLDQILLFMSPFLLPRMAGDLAAVIAGSALCLAAVSLVIATAWHRSHAHRQRIEKLGRWCAAEA